VAWRWCADQDGGQAVIGLEAEILAIVTDCKAVARTQLVRHFVLRRNILPDAVHKAIWHLIVGAVVQELNGELSLVVRPKEASEEPKPVRVKKPATPPKYDADGNRRCSTCKEYLRIHEFTSHPTTRDRLQPACRSCKLESMRRSRASNHYVLNRLSSGLGRSGTAK